MVFGGVSNVVIEKMNLIMAIIVLVLVIILGIVFDMIGMAIATCEEAPFHAKAAKKHSGAKEVLRLCNIMAYFFHVKYTNVFNCRRCSGIYIRSHCIKTPIKRTCLHNNCRNRYIAI